MLFPEELFFHSAQHNNAIEMSFRRQFTFELPEDSYWNESDSNSSGLFDDLQSKQVSFSFFKYAREHTPNCKLRGIQGSRGTQLLCWLKPCAYPENLSCKLELQSTTCLVEMRRRNRSSARRIRHRLPLPPRMMSVPLPLRIKRISGWLSE